jgi:hypothetical protein
MTPKLRLRLARETRDDNIAAATVGRAEIYMRGFLLATIGAVALAFVSVSAEAVWRPVADYVLSGIQVAFFGDNWFGIEKEPDEPSSGAVAANLAKSGSCSQRPRVTDVSQLSHHETQDTWKVLISGKGQVTAQIDESGKRYDVVGVTQDKWWVMSYRGDRGGHGTLYLEITDRGYFVGYQISDDCHSSIKGAALKCPYVLFRSAVAEAARQDPLLNERCQSVFVHPPPLSATVR